MKHISQSCWGSATNRLVGWPKLVILFKASFGAILQSADCMQLLASRVAAVSEWQKLHAPKGPVKTCTQTKTVLSVQQTVPSGDWFGCMQRANRDSLSGAHKHMQTLSACYHNWRLQIHVSLNFCKNLMGQKARTRLSIKICAYVQSAHEKRELYSFKDRQASFPRSDVKAKSAHRRLR